MSAFPRSKYFLLIDQKGGLHNPSVKDECVTTFVLEGHNHHRCHLGPVEEFVDVYGVPLNGSRIHFINGSGENVPLTHNMYDNDIVEIVGFIWDEKESHVWSFTENVLDLRTLNTQQDRNVAPRLERQHAVFLWESEN